MTQALTEDLARLMNISARSGYTDEVEWVNKYVIPLTGENREDLFREYAASGNKQRLLSEKIWARHGHNFSDIEEWGVDIEKRFKNNAVDYVGSDLYLEYLVDEIGVLNR